MDVLIEDFIRDNLPKCRLGLLTATVKAGRADEMLQNKIHEAMHQWEDKTFEEIRAHAVMADTRNAYKALGADPNRYRPASDSLLRRIVKKKGLYSINNIVDTINLISIETAYSIGGFDQNKIDRPVTLTKAPEGIEYDGIGRGKLNIANIPVLKDANGYFGTPTSDSMRTLIDEHSSNILIVFYDFYANKTLEPALGLAKKYLQQFASAESVQIKLCF